jgi:hypothetical protein
MLADRGRGTRQYTRGDAGDEHFHAFWSLPPSALRALAGICFHGSCTHQPSTECGRLSTPQDEASNRIAQLTAALKECAAQTARGPPLPLLAQPGTVRAAALPGCIVALWYHLTTVPGAGHSSKRRASAKTQPSTR